MLVVKTSLAEIPGRGIGLIAEEDIKKGMPVWVFNPLIDLAIKRNQIPVEAKTFFDTYGVDVGEDTVYINIDNARFINHSDNPNTISTGPGPKTDNIASRDICVGDEITVDYNDIDEHGVDFDY